MELSNDVVTLLNRCTAMNCLYEGQSFSRNAFSGVFVEPNRSQIAVDVMVAEGLVVKGPTGAYSLTSIGATARASAANAAKTQIVPKKFPQSRPPINKI